MLVFWEKGFTATSMHDLLEQMGISRQSLYNTFGDKRSLFHAALDHYKKNVSHSQWRVLRGDDASLPEIESFFAHVVGLAAAGAQRACMMTSSCMEHGPGDAATSRASESFAKLEALFERAIENAQRKGEISASVRPRATARHLSNTLQGLGVLMRSGADEEHVRDVVDVALSVLR